MNSLLHIEALKVLHLLGTFLTKGIKLVDDELQKRGLTEESNEDKAN